MKRYSSIDAIKAIAAFLVICIHIPFPGLIGEIIVPLARSAVPLFFVISGFFLWNKDKNTNKQKIMKHIKSVFILVIGSNVIFLIFNILVNIGSEINYLQNVFSIKNILIFLIFNESPLAGHLWYLSAYLYVLCIYYIINKYNLYKLSYFFIPALLIIDLIFGKYSLVLIGFEPPFILVRNFMFVGVPFFLLGNMLRSLEEKVIYKRIGNKILLFGFFAFSITTILEKYILTINNVNAVRDQYISTTLMTLCIFVYLVQNPELFKSSFIKTIGKKHSLNIYIIHPIIISILNYFVTRIDEKQKNTYFYFAAFIVYFISLVCSKVYLELKEKILSKKILYINT